MKVKRRIALVLLAITVQVVAVFPATAWATSSYDDVVMKGGQAKVSLTPIQPTANYSYYCGSDRLETDISTNWYTDIFKNPAAWYSDRWTPGYDQSVVDSFEAVKDTGGWALVQHVTTAGHSEYSGLYLDEGDSVVYLMWSDNPTAQFVNDNIGGSVQTPRLDMRGNWHLVAIEYQVSGNTCKPMVVGRNSGSTPTYSIQTLAYDESYTLDNGYIQFLPISINFNVSYPVGYAGEHPNRYEGGDIPRGLPVHHSGTVDCGDNMLQPVAMSMYQGVSNTGAASLTYVSDGVARWDYDLYADALYSFTVDCEGASGGWLASPHDAVLPDAVEGVWMCTVAGLGPNYCLAS